MSEPIIETKKETNNLQPINRMLSDMHRSSIDSITPLKPRSVFEFKDYRKFLAAWLEWKKKTNTQYSGSLFAKKAGLSSHTLLGMVIRGERNLSYSSIRAFSRVLNLKGREQMYFEKLVYFNQSKNSEDKADYLEQLAHLSIGNGTNALARIKDHATYLSHWYNVAIREMISLKNFNPDPEWISLKLKRKITKKQAEQALEILQRLDLIQKNPQTGKFEVLNPAIDIEPGTVDFAIRNFHKDYLERIKESIDGESIEERELSSVTVSISEQQIPKLIEKAKEFRKKLLEEFAFNQQDATHVVALNMQALILTTEEKRK